MNILDFIKDEKDKEIFKILLRDFLSANGFSSKKTDAELKQRIEGLTKK